MSRNFKLSAAVLPLVFSLGCIGDAALPIVSSTQLPSTRIVVDLAGPDRKGNYHYYVHKPDGTFAHHFLGTNSGRLLTPVKVQLIRDGVYRLQWGANSQSFFAEIDVTRSVILEDSNSRNSNKSVEEGNRDNG
jgi:hypothetical protein